MRKKAKFKKKQRFLADIEESMREVELYKEGKIKLRTIQQLLDEIADASKKRIFSRYKLARRKKISN